MAAFFSQYGTVGALAFMRRRSASALGDDQGNFIALLALDLQKARG